MINTILAGRKRLTSQPIRTKLTRTVGVSLLRFVAIGLSLVFSIVAARLLGTAEFGRYTVIMTGVGLFSIATGAGLPQLIEREIAMARGSSSLARLVPMLHSSVALLVVGIGVVIAAMACLETSGQLAALIIVVALPVGLIGAALSGYERVVERSFIESVVRPLTPILVLVVLASVAGASVETSLVAQLIATLATCGSFFIAFRPVDLSLLKRAWKYARENWKLTPEHKSIAVSGFNFAMIQLLINGTQQAEILWLNALASPEDVAHFFAAARAANAVSFFHSSTIALHGPAIVRLNAEGKIAERDQEIMRATRLSFALTCLAAIGAATVAGPYFRAFGPDFLQAQTPFYLLLFGWVTIAAFGPITYIITMGGGEKWVWIAIGIGIAIGGLSALLLIPKLGIIGGGVSFNIMLLSTNVYLLPKVKAGVGFFPFGPFRL